MSRHLHARFSFPKLALLSAFAGLALLIVHPVLHSGGESPDHQECVLCRTSHQVSADAQPPAETAIALHEEILPLPNVRRPRAQAHVNSRRPRGPPSFLSVA